MSSLNYWATLHATFFPNKMFACLAEFWMASGKNCLLRRTNNLVCNECKMKGSQIWNYYWWHLLTALLFLFYAFFVFSVPTRRMERIWPTCPKMPLVTSQFRSDIQRRGSILAWIVILSVYGADTIAIDLSLSALISWFMKSIIGFQTILIYMQ